MGQVQTAFEQLRAVEYRVFDYIADVRGIVPSTLIKELYRLRRITGKTYDVATGKYLPWRED